MEIKAPDLGVDSAEVSEIMVSVGDVIAKDDNIVLLESDKASVEVPSSAAGKVVSIAISVGDQVSEGSLLITLEAEDSADAATDTEDAKDNKAAEPAEAAPAQAEPASEPASETKQSAAPVETAAAAPQTYALPDLGVEEAQVAEIMVEVGDTVTADQSILLIESDKASVEVPAPVAGKVEKILVANGDTVANGQDFIVIVSSDATAPSGTSSQSEEQTPTPAAKQEEQAKSAAPKAEQADKQADPNKTSGKPTQAPAKLDENQVNQKLTEVYAGPAVRKLARQLGIDITQVAGTATNERIVKEDVFGYVKAHITNGAGNTAAAAPTGAARSGLPALPDMSKTEIWGETETIDLTRLQKVSIPQLNYNTYLPQVTQFDLADITDTEALRGELKGDMKKQGIGLTILAFIVKATAYALTQHPKFNSHLSDDNSQVILRKSVNMGIAVATDDGLIVPVIKDAQDKGIKQLAIEIGELAGKARDKKLGTKDLQGASFTISSQGNLGGTYFTPLVNWPQVGIMGVSEATMQPRWNAEQQTFEPRLMLPLSLSYDHRVINGADAAVFTRYVAQLLADPRRILL
ncbi:2-oxo acid dehydrogenase subunit E2 [Psychrobacter arenosus]|uniref:2-oxo acid dehydrogenase subunit E2 n=1 Tax=Psychrobacter arenosus TaxID=256326 RepID=UPI00191A18C5|nr:2-oxo acid dehydrogenase subunit E2 [Psychrobacter arenosus]